MDSDFILTIMALEEIKNLGYNEVWIGKVENPHCDYTCDNFIIASPKQRKYNWPALWSCSEKVFGEMGCGNGFRLADQMQRSNVRSLQKGYYKLVEDQWIKQNEH